MNIKSKEFLIVIVEPGHPGYHIFSGCPLPRLGGVLIGTILKSHDYPVRIYVEDLAPIDYPVLSQAQLILISTITCTTPAGYRLADWAKERNIPTVMGGSHVTFLPEEALGYTDYVVRGMGEETIVELVEALRLKKSVAEILGLSYRNEKDVITHNPNRPAVKNLDHLPTPDFSLIKGWQKMGFTPILTSLSCPHNCSFCSVVAMFGRGVKYQSPEKVIADIESFQLPPKKIFFYDDNFGVNPEKSKELLELLRKLKETGIKIPWTAQVGVGIVQDRELLDLMQETGCFYVYVGFESVNPQTLVAYQKRQNLDQMKECVDLFHRHRIKIHGMFVLGSDEDDIFTIRQTVKFAQKMKIDTVQFLVLTPIPGTALFTKLKAEQRIIDWNWENYDGMHVVFEPVKISSRQLQKEVLKAMRKFYSWHSILRQLIWHWDFLNVALRFQGLSIIKKWREKNRPFLEQLFSRIKLAKKK